MTKLIIAIGSLISIGFGVWHFFLPKLWNWYSHIDAEATELVLAVRAINLFFSLSLVLFGMANLLVVFKAPQEKFSLLVLLSASAILWASRIIMQIFYPQGSQQPALQYSLLVVFILVFGCFAFAIWLRWKNDHSSI